MEMVLVLNTGSSSIKFSLFNYDKLTLMYRGEIENITEKPNFIVFNAERQQIINQSIKAKGHESVLKQLFDWLEQFKNNFQLKAVGHRVVHGGSYFLEPTLITTNIINKMQSLNPLAPLHQPHNVAAIKIIKKFLPKMPQVACFDTTFHRSQNKLATLFAIPRKLTEEGIIRYGFHGISYEYIASVLPKYIKNKADKKIIVAHLGQGSSMCAMEKRKSIATSMGFTALDGLMMGSRCGTIDPGVLLYLLQEKKYSVEKINTLFYKESGLLGVSGISSDMRKLQESTNPNAIEAIDLFCYRAARELCALCAVLGGCDGIIFTAGIGENSAVVRTKICDWLIWLGVSLDENANKNNATIISKKKSKVLVVVIPTDEEYMLARHTKDKARIAS